MQLRLLLSTAALALVLGTPLALAILHHPNRVVRVVALGIVASAWYLVHRLRTRGDTRPLFYYLLFLYPLLAPGMLTGATSRYFVFYYSLTALFLLLPQVTRPNVLLRASCGLGLSIAIVVAAVFSVYGAQTGKLLGDAGLIASYQTNVAEATAYVRTFFDWPLLALTGALLLGLLVMVPAATRSRIRAFPRGGLLLALACALGLAWETRAYSNELRVLSTTLDYQRTIAGYRRTAASRRVDQQRIVARLRRDRPEIHVIVIGESGNRNHMGLYGYFRETTPYLSRMAAELVVFTDVIASFPHSTNSLHLALTLADVDNQLRYGDKDAFSIIELLKAAGVRTHWLSNQNRYGVWDNLVTVIAEGADDVEFLSRRIGEDERAEPDERLLPALERALSESAGPTVVFVHLMGTHWPYDQRYPPEFRHFDGPLPTAAFGRHERSPWITEMVNTYDNANLYVDYVLNRMLGLLRRRPGPSTLLYFADHGEAPLEGFGHDAARFNRDQVEVPLFLWFSEQFKALHPELVRIATANRDKPFMLDKLEDTVLDLVGVETPYQQPEHSLLRATYAAPSRMTLDGKVDYDAYDDPLLNARRNIRRIGAQRPGLMKRIWAHRVNSLGKLSEVVDTFAGAELDLVFDEAAKGLTVRDGPTLEEILDAPYVRHRQIGLWLDLENLNTENSSKILAQLSSLDVRHGLKDRVIVATAFTGEGLDRFAASGFYTSYHLPGERIGEAMERGDTERLSHLAAEACAVAHRQRVAAVSFDSGLYPFVRNYLTRCVNAADLEYLTWDLAVSSSTRGFADTVSQWSLDDRVKVVLVPFASRFD